MDQASYWATAAQIMAVLALALVIEARAIMSRWSNEHPRVIKRLQGALWAVPLAIYGIMLPRCLKALRGGHIWEGTSVVVELGISLGLGVLVLSPALDILIRANSYTVAKAIVNSVTSIYIWQQQFFLRRRMRHSRRGAAEAERDVRQVMNQVLNYKHEVENQSGNPECTDRVIRLNELNWYLQWATITTYKIDRLRRDIQEAYHIESGDLRSLKAGRKNRVAKLESKIARMGTLLHEVEDFTDATNTNPDNSKGS